MATQPVEVSELFRDILESEGFQVEISDTLDAFLDVEKLKALDQLSPSGPWAGLPKSRLCRWWKR